MLDLNLIRSNPEYVREALKKREYDVDFSELLEWDARRRALLVENPAWDALLDWLGRWISFSDLLAVPVLFVLILLMYTFMPGGKRPLRPQVPGTVFTTAGWVVFSRAFSFYIVHFWRLSYIYGSLTAIVLMILWLDIIINLFFLGAALNAALARKID